MKKSVTSQLIFLLSLLAATAVLGASSTFFILSGQEVNTKIIDIAGRQRMLSQNMTKNSLLLNLYFKEDERTGEIYDSLESSQLLFDKSLKALSYGGETMGTNGKMIVLPPAGAQALEVLEGVQLIWMNMNPAINSLKYSFRQKQLDQMETDLSVIIAENNELLKRANDAVVALKIQSDKSVVFLRILQIIFASTAILVAMLTYYLIRKWLINPLRRTAQDEKAARMTAEKANKAKSVFLSNMSHEIRTPLNAILGFSQLMLKDSSLEKEQKTRLNTIFRSGEHLLNLINDILDISKIESGQVFLHKDDFYLRALLDDLELMFNFQTREKGLRFSMEKLSDIPDYIHGDEKKIRQILINLLGNAIKFTKDGGISLVLSVKKKEQCCEIVFEVRDTGSGIEKENLEKIFKSFAQTDNGWEVGGTGLGLAISRKLAELMSGSLTVTSELGRGSTFTLRLPYSPAESACLEPEDEDFSNVQRISKDSKNKHILIVDDIMENRLFLLEFLTPLGFDTRTAGNGLEALEVLEGWDADAVLMDLRMPRMNGYEATKEIHKRLGEDYPVIAITANAFEHDPQNAIFSGYIKKPFKVSQLLKTLKKILDVEYECSDNRISSFSWIELDMIPESIRLELLAAVQQGEISIMRSTIEKLQQEYSDLSSALLELVNSYNYEKLIALLSE